MKNDTSMLLLLAIYMLPAVIAWYRRHKQEMPIAIVNLAFGWTIIGWVGCLAWACSHLKDEDRQTRHW